MTRPIISFDGIDGSGKSTLASRIRERRFGEDTQCILLRVDDFRSVLDWDKGDEAALYYEHYFDLAGMGRVVRAFVAGAPLLRVPSFDGAAGVPTGIRTLAAGPSAVLLIEGVFIRRIPVPDATMLHVYLETDPARARERLILRDTGRGRDRQEVVRRLERRYIPGQLRYHAERMPRERANILLDNSAAGPPRLLEDRTPPPLRDLAELVLVNCRAATEPA